MVKIPKYIKESIEKASIYQARAFEHNEKVRGWLKTNGISEDVEGAVIDYFIDCIEMSKPYDCRHGEFISFLEKYEKGE